MDEKEREEMIQFCRKAIADLHGVPESYINRSSYDIMPDDILIKEVDWLDDLLNK